MNPRLRPLEDVFPLGVRIQPRGLGQLLGGLIRPATPPVTVLYANPHVLNTAYRDPALHRALGEASIVYLDGSGVRLGAWLLGHRLPSRLTAADWIDDFCEASTEYGRRLYFVAGAPGVAERAAALLAERHPGLQIVGTHHGYLDDAGSDAVIEDMNRASADIVLVGMGTPIQERWIGRHRSRIEAPVVWAVGALLDFVAGEQLRAPAWLRRVHLEWLWRLGTDPARLWRRYVIGNPLFIARVLRQRVFGLPGHLRSPHQHSAGSR